jgi:hypothetical protein
MKEKDKEKETGPYPHSTNLIYRIKCKRRIKRKRTDLIRTPPVYFIEINERESIKIKRKTFSRRLF